MTAYPQKLIIHCPSHFATKYTGITSLFNTDGNLQLLIPASDYARLEEGDASKFYYNFSGTGVTLSPRRVGMNVTVSDQRFEIRLALEELVALSLSTNYKNYTPITILDYVRPEWQDYSQGYTQRVGKIESFDDGSKGGGTVRRGYRQCGTNGAVEVLDSPARVYGGGFRFRFLELQQRLIA